MNNHVDLDAARLHRLTPRQAEILAGVAQGLSTTDIAKALYVGEATVYTHLKAVFGRWNVPNRAAAVGRAYDVGVLRTAAGRGVAG